MAKIAPLESQIASLKLQRKSPEPSPHRHHQRSKEVAANQGATTVLGEDIASTISEIREESASWCKNATDFFLSLLELGWSNGENFTTQFGRFEK
ncbi:hypothetical protein TNCV_2834821 [Trichonephila clavipes]|nr:hypothetical protein TNCV_2834821 [Trichonephila clavipes]